MSRGYACGEAVRERGEGRAVATAAVLDFLRVAERRADVLVAALALDDLGAMLGEEPRRKSRKRPARFFSGVAEMMGATRSLGARSRSMRRSSGSRLVGIVTWRIPSSVFGVFTAFGFVLDLVTHATCTLHETRPRSLSDLTLRINHSRNARVRRRFPPRRRPRTRNVDPFEEHRQFVHVDLHALRLRCHARRKNELPALETLVHDRVAAARPHQKLYLILPPIQKHEDVTAQWVPCEDGSHLVREALE